MTPRRLLTLFLPHVWRLVRLGEREPTTLKLYCSLSGIVPDGFRFRPKGHGERNFAPIADRPLLTLSLAELQDWLYTIAEEIRESGGHAGITAANRCLILLDTAWKWAQLEGLLPDGVRPVQRVKRFKELPRWRYLEPHEIADLRAAIQSVERMRVRMARDGHALTIRSMTQALLLITLTALRLTEALTLRVEHVDLKARALKLPKTKTTYREVPLPELAVRQLARQLKFAQDGWVFPSYYGGPVRGIYDVWKECLEASGIRTDGVVIHTLRHSVATFLLRIGVSVDDVADILGHASNQITKDIYNHCLATVTAREALNRYAAALTPARGVERECNQDAA